MSTENTIKWKTPSGNELITNDSKESIKYLEHIGFKQIKPKAKPGPKPKAKAEE